MTANPRPGCGVLPWGVAALAGLLVMAILFLAVQMSASVAIFFGLIFTAILGVILFYAMCGSVEEEAPAAAPQAAPAEPRPVAAAAADAAPAPVTAAPQPAEPREAAPKAGEIPDGDATGAIPPAGDMSEDYDEDGVLEGQNEGTRPPTLNGPRGGRADNLKEIKGIGPKLEKLCNRLGFYHFDQIAAWSPDEVAWVNANLEGFKGRVSRDTWVEQAKVLSAGGETEFSKRVDKGEVY